MRMLYMQNKKLEAQLKKQSEELQELRQTMGRAGTSSGGKRVAVPRECSVGLNSLCYD